MWRIDTDRWAAPVSPARGWSRWARSYLVVGLALLANGAGLVLHIVNGIPLPPLLLLLWAVGLGAIALAFARADAEIRDGLRRTFVAGVGAGLVATATYDVAKALLSTLDPAPWNPFEATRVFGIVLLGEGASDLAQRIAGWAFHLSNGATFGMSFAFVFGARARAGVAWAVGLGAMWGVFLESFQLALYPGWIGIPGPALAEFQQVSFLAHAVFGATLGLLCRRWLPKEPGWG
jgi:hypothetical protein